MDGGNVSEGIPLKKITCIIHSLGLGGMERVMSLLLNEFVGREYVAVDLILIGKERKVEFPLSSRVNIHRPSFDFDDSKRNQHTLKTLIFLRKKIMDIKPNSILSFGELWNNFVLLALLGLPFPVFISDRSQPDKDLGKLHNFLRSKLYPKAAGFIGQTEYAANNALKKKWNNNIKTIGNPIRKILCSEFHKREKIVVTVGRLIPTKNIKELVDLFLKINMPHWKLLVIGGNAKNNDLLTKYRNYIVELGAGDRIQLLGGVKDVEKYYQIASIFAFASSSEGFPNVIGEALSAELPVVAFDCIAGPSEMIEDGVNGFLVPVRSFDAFKEKLKMLMEDECLRKSFSEKAFIKIQKFEQQYICNEFFNFITKNKF
ncbi:glycosyltransferase [Pleomorphovibrio marinus]|uniref:glycosyltransferase n=1 Tax=Pleomorphovibrio marinus TaxID=2164132 RepID=UPI001E3F5DE9|nr:glycosyltransferase [Pleomorphovibrio marinus]